MSNINERIRALSPDKRALLERMRAEKEAQHSRQPTIPSRGASSTAPLSFAQERLWFLDQLEPGNPIYNQSAVIRLIGKLNVAAFESSFATLIQRHEILRTTFHARDGRPIQTIVNTLAFQLPTVDLTDFTPQEQTIINNHLSQKIAAHHFDLALGPLLQVLLVRLAPEEHLLFVCMHHIISDGWSSSVLVSELSTLYTTTILKKPVLLTALPIQYADFALWQRQWLQGQVLEQYLAYWRHQLADVPALLELPTDRPRPSVQTFRGANYIFTLPAEMVERLRHLGQRLQAEDGTPTPATLFMVLLTGWVTLLARVSGQQDLVIGSPIANRTLPEVQNLVGCLFNTLLLRVKVAENPQFHDLLRQVREVALDAYAHQDLPFEKLVEALAPVRSLSYNPLFQVVFGLQNYPTTPTALPGLTLTPCRVESQTARCDLMVLIDEDEHGCSGYVEYSTDLFDTSTIVRLFVQYRTLLNAVIADPHCPVERLPLLSEQERRQVLQEWNATHAPALLSPQHSVATHLLTQGTLHPDAIAVCSGDEHLSYRALLSCVQHLAFQLQHEGVGPDVLVALLDERGIPLLLTLLAIFWLGGAYLPLDPRHPPSRWQHVVYQSGATLVLVGPTLAPSASYALQDAFALSPVRLRQLPSPFATHAEAPSTALPPAPSHAEQLAYVIYTSGSTGQPKGAMVTQRGMLNHLQAKITALELTTSDILAQTAHQCFDISVWQFFAPLLTGGRVQILPDEQAHHPTALLDAVQCFAISLLEVVPSLLRAMIEEMEQDGNRKRVAGTTLRWLIPTGEALPVELARGWLRLYPGVPLLNAYGPTECSDDVTHHPIWEVIAPMERTSLVPIGRPVVNTQVYILDQYSQPVPIGVAGELFVGGVQVGRGYLYDPMRTAERFVPDPFGVQLGGRLYATGDLARYRADGTVEFLGRIDQQVKVRGYRIELGEIEAVLGELADVREAVVMLRADAGMGSERLVAYVVHQLDEKDEGQSRQQERREEWRRQLRQRLPEYMVPTAFVELAALPLTPNGKLDRRALPVPEQGQIGHQQSYVAPRTPVEETLAGIWAEVLGLSQVSIHDNFFELGGHSLLATQLVARVRTAFGIELPLRTLFETATLAQLAQHLAQLASDQPEQILPPIQVAVRPAALPLSFAQQRLWFLDQLEPGNRAYTIPLVLHLQGTLSLALLERSLHTIVHRQESLRTSIVMEDGQASQQIATTVSVVIPVVDLSGLPEATREEVSQHLSQQMATSPFDVQQGPLWRLLVVRHTPQEHLLLLTMHHIISDGWSMGVFIQEVAAGYVAAVRGTAPILPLLPIQYADFALWQRQWLQDGVLEQHLAYWRHQLADAPALLELPTDRSRPPVQTFRGANHRFLCPSELVNRLRHLGQRLQTEDGTSTPATLFMVLLTGWAMLLARVSGQHDVVIGSPIANRTRKELEGLIGLFVNTLALRIQFQDTQTVTQVLQHVREVALGAYAHQDLPFEKLVEELAPVRQLNSSPLFQVLFILQNAPQPQLELEGMRLETWPVDNHTAKFDLSLELGEREEGLWGRLEYNTDLFEAETIERLAHQLQRLLEGMVAQPTGRVGELSLLTAQEREQILYGWNATQQLWPQHACIHELISQQAQRTPDAIAVVCGEEYLSYGELERRANQLAQYLQQQGVGPEILVGICLERSLDLLIGLLGILKAGGAYLPLDPSYPPQRLRFMLEESRATLVLTHAHLQEVLKDSPCPVYHLDELRQALATLPTHVPMVNSNSQRLAYVIYTSGSTGRPKGAMNAHAGIVNRLDWMQHAYALQPHESVLQKTPISFDVSVWELFWPLQVGARLVLARPEGHRDPHYLVQLIGEQEITFTHFVPSLLRVFLEEPEVAQAGKHLRHVICSGEELTKDVYERFEERLAGVRLANLYGPTETAVDVTAWQGEDEPNQSRLPIGRPLTNTQVYILDQHGQPVPIGVAGELFIGGVQVGRGYLYDPVRTAERFVPDPFGEQLGGRLYRTGDLARYRADGMVEFLGRIDQQVKLRGYRIELGEIEAVLGELAGVREAVVMLRADAGVGSERLVAYVVHQLDEAGNEEDEGQSRQQERREEWRRQLRQHLPEYMVPTAFVELAALPLMPNGKLDRQALPAPEQAHLGQQQSYVAPRTPVEEVLAGIWAEVLGLPQVGIYDNFFSLGGDSIRSIQVLARTRDRNLPFDLQQLFQYQTIADLAHALIIKNVSVDNVVFPSTSPFSLISEAERNQLPTLIEDAYPLTAMQLGMLFQSELNGDSVLSHQIFSFHLRASLDLSVLRLALEQVAQRHPILRTSFDLSHFSQPLQLVWLRVPVLLTTEDLSDLTIVEQEERIAAWYEQDQTQQFNWQFPPLWRIYIHHRSLDTFQFTFSFHHAILDGWSLASLLTELFQRYRALAALGPHAISDLADTPLVTTFRDFVALEQRELVSQDALRFWEEMLKDAPSTLLPHGLQKPLRSDTSVHIETPKKHDLATLDQPGIQQQHSYEKSIDPTVFTRLQYLVQQEGVPLKSVLLAAYVRVLQVLNGQDDLVTGLVVNGRPDSRDGERILGLFLNTQPFRMKLNGTTWRELIRQTFELERNLLPFRHYPFARLQYQLGNHLLFDTVFNFTHFHVYQDVLFPSDMELLAERTFAQTDFALTVNPHLDANSSELRLSLAYNKATIAPEQAEIIGDYYVRALTMLANDPDSHYETATLLSEQERRQILQEWNATQAPALLSPEYSVAAHLLAQGTLHPDAIAVCSGDKHLSYHALLCCVQHLASQLQHEGVGPDVLVALLDERGIPLLLALLAIFWLGGGYVPLDPRHPPSRWQHVVHQSGATLVLAGPILAPSAYQMLRDALALSPIRVWQLPSPLATHAEAPSMTLQPAPSYAEQLAYVIYTSGSTGQPKGAMVTQRGMLNHLQAKITALELTTSDILAQTAHQCFDISVWQFFAPLLTGGRVQILPDEQAHHPTALLDAVQCFAISLLEVVPSLLRAMIEEMEQDGNRKRVAGTTLRWLIPTGEALSVELAQGWQRLYPGVPLLNAYGPTECSDDVTHHPIWEVIAQMERTSLVPIGRPVVNTQVYILDQYGQPVPIGVIGELFVGGVQVGRGYLHDPMRTAERYVPDPFGKQLGGRLYATGDLARYRAEGTVEFLGRMDQQVKLRGYRIELGEIEAALCELAGVREAVVMLRADAGVGSERLVAYVVYQSDEVATGNDTTGDRPVEEAERREEWRRQLRQRVPEYMVPTAFVELVALPLTPNGKLDRRALPVPEQGQIGYQQSHVAPRTPVEETLAGIWAEVLGLPQVSIHDNFFELGGHSLLATQLVARVRTALGIELPLRILFDASTIVTLGSVIEKIKQGEPLTSLSEPVHLDLNREVVLDYAIHSQGVLYEYVQEPRAIFLTGATGFLGTHLLWQLLADTSAVIYCLVRSSDAKEGVKRIQVTLEAYELWNQQWSLRIVPVVGELSQPLFGLSLQQFEDLAQQIDVIYHCGAWVNFIYPYHALKPANVLGTQEVLRLASWQRIKPVHHISTLSAFIPSDPETNNAVSQTEMSKQVARLEGGYAQSKWVAEQLVLIAQARGIPVTIYRPGFIGGHSQTGINQMKDILWAIVKGCIQLGSAPLVQMDIDLTPVDHVSSTIVHLSQRPDSPGRVFHITHARPLAWSDLLKAVLAQGYSVRLVDYAQWHTELLTSIEHSRENALYPFISLLPEKMQNEHVNMQEIGIRPDQQDAFALSALAHDYPAIDVKLLDAYFAYFIRSGFLPPPDKQEQC